MTSLMQGPFEVEWMELEAGYFQGHDHVWQMDDGVGVFVCVEDGCPSKEQGE